MVKINGEMYDYAGLTIKEMLEKLEFSTERIATEINGDIVTKANYDTTYLKDEDTVEVVSFVGGG
ncbi:MAG: sulfur carrier protein ThiS [Eubacterium sp.]|nr:sulfur carrier protein ThiS [Eubacterium sp.]